MYECTRAWRNNENTLKRYNSVLAVFNDTTTFFSTYVQQINYTSDTTTTTTASLYFNQ